MLSWVYLILIILSLAFALFTGKLPDLTPALLQGAENGVKLLLSVGGPLVFWSGLSEVLSEAGFLSLLSRLLRPLLRFLIRPKTGEDEVMLPLAENFSANLLGVGNAATPPGLRAADLLWEKRDEEGLARLALLNSRSVQLLPFTAAALSSSLGDPHPFSLTPAILLVSLFSLAVSFLLFGLLLRLFPGREKTRG